MTLTTKMLIGAIAANPAKYEGPGEYRYSIPHRTIYYTSANNPDPKDNEAWLPVPALNPDGSKRMEYAFRNFVARRWKPSRQRELEEFALKKGWDLAMELKYGGGALEDYEADEWQVVVNRELERMSERFIAEVERL